MLAHFEGNLKANLALLGKTQKLPKLAKFDLFCKFKDFARFGIFSRQFEANLRLWAKNRKKLQN